MGCTVSISKSPVRESKVDVSGSKHQPKQTFATQNTGSSDKQTLSNPVGKPSITEEHNKESENHLKSLKESQERGELLKNEVLTILHFNDVYNIEPRDKEPIGGAARFAHKLASYKNLNPLTVFSGDVLNPSKGKYA